jgi:membrane-associated phospholipid phosphatase
MIAAGLGLLISQAITHFWDRPRPSLAHPHDTILLVSPSSEPSFPSDHAVAAFAIAFTVAIVSTRAGALFLAAATVLSLARVVAGLHYPGDVLGGAAIGLVSALLVFWLASGRLPPLVGVLSRLTDPLVSPVWRALDREKERRRARTWPAGGAG